MTPSEKIAKARKLLEEAGQELTAKLQSDRTRARGATVRELHSIGPLRGEVAQFYSQAGQDRIVDGGLGPENGRCVRGCGWI